MFSAEPQRKRKREDKISDGDKHLSAVLSITNSAIRRNMSLISADQNQNADGFLKEKDVQDGEDDTFVKRDHEQLKKDYEYLKILYKMSDMKIQLTKISKIEEENQMLKNKIKSLEAKLVSQKERHQKLEKDSEKHIRKLNENFYKVCKFVQKNFNV